MSTIMKCAAFCGLVVLLSGQRVEAQNLYASFIEKFDANKDGKVEPEEVTGLNKRVYERMLAQFKLEKDKTYTVAELKEATGGPSLSSSSSSNSSGRRSFSSRRSSSRRRGSYSGRSSDKKYRSLIKLPSSYSTYDKDGDGQIGLYEWPRARIPEFLKLDKNDDGFLTLRETRKGPTSSRSSSSDDDEKEEEKKEDEEN